MTLAQHTVTPVNASKERPCLPSLTGLRFVAAFLVLFAHGLHVVCRASSTQLLHQLGTSLAYLGMTMFFVLSGFVIHYNYGVQFLTRPFAGALRCFAVARFARLYPMYLVTFLICVVTTATSSRVIDSLPVNSYVLSIHLAMTQSWVYLPTYTGSWNISTSAFFPHGWSISTEIFFYFLYPLLLLPVSRLRRVRAILSATAFFVIAAFTLVCLVRSERHLLFRVLGLEHWNECSVDMFAEWLAYFSPAVRFLEFCLGCLAAQLYLTVRDVPLTSRETKAGFVCLLLAGAILLLLLFPPSIPAIQFLQKNFLYAPACAVLTFCLVRYNTVFSRVLNLRPIVLLGEASYSMYLLQHFLFHAFVSPVPVPIRLLTVVDWVLRLTLVLGLVFAISVGTYQCVEVPARNWIRRLFTASRASGDRALFPSLKVVSVIVLIPTLFFLTGYGLYRKYQLPLVYCARATARAGQGNATAALADLNAALRLAPGHLQALLQRGLLLQRAHRHGEAIADFTVLLNKRPRDITALQGRAEAFACSQDWQQALADYNQAVLIVPTFSPHYYLRAQVLRQLGHIGAALADCTRALELNPEYADVYYLRAQLRELTADDSGAFHDYANALHINPHMIEAACSRAHLREKQGNLTAAVQDYQRVLELNPDHAEARAKVHQRADRRLP